jgi:multidrug efflux pump subunit AcrA (membrane-fusion protein)
MQRDVAAPRWSRPSPLEARNVTLSYTRITSPIDGRVGHQPFRRSLVNPASGVLVEVVQLDPIRIAFALEEGHLPPKPDSMRISAP